METNGSPSEEMLEKLRAGKMIQLAPIGISMIPFIRGGEDRVLLRKKEDVNVGDIVLVRYGKKMILHRVYAINGDQLTMMGDGNLEGTEEADRSEVLGTVLQIIKLDGRCRKPHKAWLWRHLLPFRRILLKIDRKWNKYFVKHIK